MTRTINEVYESIAQNIVNSISSDWKNSNLEVELYDDAAEFDATFETGTGEVEDFSFDIGQAYDDFEELYAIMTEENDHHKWNRAKFKLTPDGKFSIDFDWDQELFDEIARLNAE